MPRIEIINDPDHGPCIHALTLRDACRNTRHPNAWVGEKADRLGLRKDIDYWGTGRTLHVSLSAALRLAAASNVNPEDSAVIGVRNAILRVTLLALADIEQLRENLLTLRLLATSEHEKAKSDDVAVAMRKIEAGVSTIEDRQRVLPVKELRLKAIENERESMAEAVNTVFEESNHTLNRLRATLYAVEPITTDTILEVQQ